MTNTYKKTISFLARTEDEEILLSHVADLMDRSEYETVSTDFLNLSEQFLVRSFLLRCGGVENLRFSFYGGYPFAERKMLFLFPEYVSDTIAAAPSVEQDALCVSLCAAEERIGAISVRGSGYRSLSHRDYLGSLLSLGIERSVIGDISVSDSAHAVVFLKNTMCDYVSGVLERIGSDKVHLSPLPPAEAQMLPDSRKYEIISDTIASPRLDAIVSVCANVSRDKAKQLVTSGLTEVDFRPLVRPDAEIVPGMYLSIRGYGRFYFDAIDGTSKKGRLRVRLKKTV